MRITTNRPILHGGNVTTEIETTSQHARELATRGLISIQPKVVQAHQKPAKPKAR